MLWAFGTTELFWCVFFFLFQSLPFLRTRNFEAEALELRRFIVYASTIWFRDGTNFWQTHCAFFLLFTTFSFASRSSDVLVQVTTPSEVSTIGSCAALAVRALCLPSLGFLFPLLR